MDDTTKMMQQSTKGLFAERLDVEFAHCGKDEIRATVEVKDHHCTTPGVMHGGAIMAIADTLGAYGTALNLPPGAGTTTVESKTNFFSKASPGQTVTAVSTPLHRGRSTMVWQTKVTRPDGKLVALVTQTQIVLPAKKSAEEQMAGLFAEGEASDHQALLARLERAGGGLYRAWAEAATGEDEKRALLEAADREDENAVLLEKLTAGGGD